MQVQESLKYLEYTHVLTHIYLSLTSLNFLKFYFKFYVKLQIPYIIFFFSARVVLYYPEQGYIFLKRVFLVKFCKMKAEEVTHHYLFIE